MGQVAYGEGSVVKQQGRTSLSDCKELCNSLPECHSFAHCPKYGSYCFLTDKIFTGSEPTYTKNGYCTTYYEKTPQPTPGPTIPGCRNLSAFCEDWAKKGVCTDMPDVAKDYCRRSCNLCETEGVLYAHELQG